MKKVNLDTEDKKIGDSFFGVEDSDENSALIVPVLAKGFVDRQSRNREENNIS